MDENPISVRLGDLRPQLQKLADNDRRTLSGYIRNVLAAHVTQTTEEETVTK